MLFVRRESKRSIFFLLSCSFEAFGKFMLKQSRNLQIILNQSIESEIQNHNFLTMLARKSAVRIKGEWNLE